MERLEPDAEEVPQSVLARNLQAEYARTGLSRNALAKLAKVKVDVLRDIERRGNTPSAARLDAIARALGRTPGQLLGTEPMTEPGEIPPLTSLPPEMVKDQTQLQLIRWWGELSARERRVILDVVRGLALGE